jgi:hypothetical protein
MVSYRRRFFLSRLDVVGCEREVTERIKNTTSIREMRKKEL